MLETTDPGGAAAPLSSNWHPMRETEVIDLLRFNYGVEGRIARLSSERDETFKVVSGDGNKFTLKVANPAEEPATLEFQNDVLMHLAAAAPQVPVPKVVFSVQGESTANLRQKDGSVRVARLLTYLDGEQQVHSRGSVEQNLSLGRALAELGIGLQSFEKHPPGGKLLWDITHTLDLAGLITHVGSARQALVSDVLDEFSSDIPGRLPALRKQIIHNDFNPHNILVGASAPDKITGIIDFGDMVHAPLVNDLAVAISYHLATSDWRARAGAVIRGFHAVRPLAQNEIEVLPVLIKARLAMTILITEWRASIRPENSDYILRNHGSALHGLGVCSGMTRSDLDSFILQNCEA